MRRVFEIYLKTTAFARHRGDHPAALYLLFFLPPLFSRTMRKLMEMDREIGQMQRSPLTWSCMPEACSRIINLHKLNSPLNRAALGRRKVKKKETTLLSRFSSCHHVVASSRDSLFVAISPSSRRFSLTAPRVLSSPASAIHFPSPLLTPGSFLFPSLKQHGRACVSRHRPLSLSPLPSFLPRGNPRFVFPPSGPELLFSIRRYRDRGVLPVGSKLPRHPPASRGVGNHRVVFTRKNKNYYEFIRDPHLLIDVINGHTGNEGKRDRYTRVAERRRI
ncbi:hypothetical protein PUN28_016624 [Cardiocondyla obscurior]|uniref:Uncharacterized protein n=1 Tax=Cardiocondyla obscurior TaxID=286306 RepID=A0AAW2ERQ2_9HYME